VPNVIVILLDSFGSAGSKTFGGVLNVPTIERLAQGGLDLQQFPYGADLLGESRGAAHGTPFDQWWPTGMGFESASAPARR
jgi:arylsulfatase A-like enzyme